MRNTLYLIFGWVAVILGLVGVVLPGLPTTPFMLVAAFAFSRGSPRWHKWLINHRIFGGPIRDWQHRGAISRRAKAMAVAAMALVFAISLFVLSLPLWALAAQGLCLLAVAVFILSRPD